MKNRVGLLGGTFNPIHYGHIDLGLKIKDAFKLDYIRYILSAKPPHKKSTGITDSNIRWNMLEIALKKKSGLIPCDIELKREEPSYTIETVKEMADFFPEEEHYFIIGSDSFLMVETWKDYIDLFNMISFIVVLREEHHKKDAMKILDKIGIQYDHTRYIDTKQKKNNKMVFFYSYNSDKLYYSSTIVRKNISEGKEIKDLVDPEIINIIKGKGLYGSK